jgi:tRNA(Arg) A34 adenosine deaminase TadA
VTDQDFMHEALDVCRQGVEFGQSPFGACIVADGRVVARTHNRVWATTDPTAHAEVCCIREACTARGRVHLADCTIYSTTEPCPMCFSAIHWARIPRIVYAATIEDARDFGFNELPISNQKLREISGAKVELVGAVLRDEALALYRLWVSRRDHRAY